MAFSNFDYFCFFLCYNCFRIIQLFIRLVKTYYVSFTERAMISPKSPFTYILHKTKNGISESYIAKIIKMNEKYILPSFDERDINTMKYSDILEF